MDAFAENRAMMVQQATSMIMSMVSVVVSTMKRKRKHPDSDDEAEPNPLMYDIRSDAEAHRQRTLLSIYHSTDIECLSVIRMKRQPYFALCNLFRERGLLRDNAGVSIEEQVSMFLLIICHNQRFRVVHLAFRRSIETVHRHFHQVLYVVCELRYEMIKPPSTQTMPKSLGAC